VAIPSSRSAKSGDNRGYPRSARAMPSVNNEATAPTPPVVPPAPKVPTTPATGLLTDEIRELIKLVEASDITELAIENGEQKIHIKREKMLMVAAEQPATQRSPKVTRTQGSAGSANANSSPPIPDPGSPPEDSFHKIVAPMVGTFYSSPDSKARAFVSAGEMVEKGQVIGIIEAMKIMNEIVSEHAGRCVKVNVENGQPVEYGQTLLLLEPA